VAQLTAEAPAGGERRCENEPVTVVVTHHVAPGREAEFGGWLVETARLAGGFPGYAGYVAIPPRDGSSARHIAFRYERLAQLEAFWRSDAYAGARERLEELITEPSEYRREIGIEHWYVPPGMDTAMPSRHRMAVVVFVSILPLAGLIPPRLVPWLSEYMPAWLAGVLTTAVIVVLMTYAVMPLATRLFEPWLRAGGDDR
jgi:antibiotic biosynthesis monooxygenase (ABM) superfamily enzyme